MANTTDFQQHATNLLAKLKTKKEAAERDYKVRLAEIDREIEAVSITLRLLREPQGVTVPLTGLKVETQLANIVPITNLVGKTLRAALAIIAGHNGGILRVTEAKPLLLNAGVLKKPKHAWGAIYTTLSRSPEFKKIPDEKGAFQLVMTDMQKTLLDGDTRYNVAVKL